MKENVCKSFVNFLAVVNDGAVLIEETHLFHFVFFHC
jgi:hypothetical protein